MLSGARPSLPSLAAEASVSSWACGSVLTATRGVPCVPGAVCRTRAPGSRHVCGGRGEACRGSAAGLVPFLHFHPSPFDEPRSHPPGWSGSSEQ